MDKYMVTPPPISYLSSPVNTTDTFTARIYLSGPIDVAKQYLRQECMNKGLCVNIQPTDYVYTGGEESGYVVELVNYPRFPTTQQELTDRARLVMRGLLEATYQRSALIVFPTTTEWYSNDPANHKTVDPK